MTNCLFFFIFSKPWISRPKNSRGKNLSLKSTERRFTSLSAIKDKEEKHAAPLEKVKGSASPLKLHQLKLNVTHLSHKETLWIKTGSRRERASDWWQSSALWRIKVIKPPGKNCIAGFKIIHICLSVHVHPTIPGLKDEKHLRNRIKNPKIMQNPCLLFLRVSMLKNAATFIEKIQFNEYL